MSLTINANMANYIENGTLFTEKEQQGNRKTFFAGNTNLVNDPIAEKRKEAQKKAMKVVSDAWNADKAIDKSVEDRNTHYNDMLRRKEEAQSNLKNINEQIDALKEDYGITEDSEYKDWPEEYKERYFELKDQADAFKKEIHDADKLMKDDIADIKAIALERLKSDPMVDAQKTADAIEAAANEEIIGMAMQEAKEHIDEKLEEIREIKALQEAIIQGTKEAVAEAEARRQENEAPELPLDELMKLTKTNSETAKAQDALDEIKYSMNLLEADLKGIKVDEEV